MAPSEITSPNNARIKQARALMARRKARTKAGRCVLEGARLVGDALDAGARPEYVLFTPDFAARVPGAALLARLDAAGTPCLSVAPGLLGGLADTETPSGILAVCALPRLPYPERAAFVLLLDRIKDPGNLGAMLRTASAAGVDGVALLKGTADPFNPKVLRAGMGAQFRVPLAHLTDAELPALPIVLADASGRLRYDAFDWTQDVALAIGAEAHGFSDAVQARAAARVYIPMARDTESLNAAAAVAVILFEARRQRMVRAT